MSKDRPVVAFFPAHPAQLWLMNSVVTALGERITAVWVLRDKDVLIDIANRLNIEYVVISRAKTGLLGNMLELLANTIRAVRLTKKYKINLWFTKYGAGNIASVLCGRRSISFNDDDIDIVPLIAITSYPFAKKILAPRWVRMGRFDQKTIRFNASNELVYLHPKRFSPDYEKLKALNINDDQPFILIRMSALDAHHDVGIRGLSEQFLETMINRYQNTHQLFISSEKSLSDIFSKYHLRTNVYDIHHVLHAAACIVTDSLSMALEGAILGTASVRLSDFGLQVSAFKAIEKYELIYNLAPDETEAAIAAIDQVLKYDASGEISRRSKNLIDELEDPLPYFTDTILDQLERGH
jgi:predicted glycosyltransferase